MAVENSGAAFKVGDWLVEPQLDTLSRGGEVQKLEPRTMRLLLCLAAAAGRPVSIEQLLDEVWAGVVVSPASVYQAISQLRKLLGDTDPNPTYIATVPRKGYRLIAPIVKAGPEQGALVEPKEPAPPPIAASSPRRRVKLKLSIAVAVIMAAALIAWMVRLRQEERGASIAVLPIVDLSEDKSSQAFCDGLTEELSNWLAQLPKLQVVSRTSAFAFQGHSEDVRKIGKQLDTQSILEGSMRRSGDHMRITVQLIDARSGYHLWSANYDRTVADTIAMQEEISRSVAENLQIRMTPQVAPRFAARRTSKPQAYESYLLARHEQQARTPEANQRAIQLYREALGVDPQFALADVGLAYALLNERWLGERPIEAIATEAEPLLNAALRLDPILSDTYTVRGALRAEQQQDDAAMADLDKAVELNPNDSEAFRELGRLQLNNKGQPRDALMNYTRAAALDPMNYLPQAQRCLVLQDLGRFEESADACARARTLQPDAYWPLDVTSVWAYAQGRLDEALAWNQRAMVLAPSVSDLPIERAAWLLILGLPAQARGVVERTRSVIDDNESIDDLMSQVAYAEGGAEALRKHLEGSHLEESTEAGRLFSAAYYRMLAGDVAAAGPLVKRGLKAAEAASASPTPWSVARFGHHDGLTAAMVEFRLGDQAAARRHLDAVAATLELLVRNGDKRFAVEELLATVQSLRGDLDGAMRHLSRAADLGWRRSWWAEREPDVSALWGRKDFAALMARINASNAELRTRVKD
jgi:TolB-like protein/DNA-binding winged helix-turn-helix (wHTH) protein/tetratricopeptide (TPR) repeat protein